MMAGDGSKETGQACQFRIGPSALRFPAFGKVEHSDGGEPLLGVLGPSRS